MPGHLPAEALELAGKIGRGRGTEQDRPPVAGTSRRCEGSDVGFIGRDDDRLVDEPGERPAGEHRGIAANRRLRRTLRGLRQLGSEDGPRRGEDDEPRQEPHTDWTSLRPIDAARC